MACVIISLANEVQPLHVHFVDKHSQKKKCGLCDKEFENSKLLDDHLSQSEVFICSNSGCRESFIAMKQHIDM